MSRKYPTSKRQQGKKQNQPKPMPTIWIFSGILVVGLVIIGLVLFFSSPKTDPLDKSEGPADAKVVITEYGDFQCPACKVFALEVAPKIKKDFVDTGKARFAFRQMAFVGQESTLAAEASECANDQGHFWDYYTKLYESQGIENAGTYTLDSLTSYAKSLNLDTDKFSQCLSTGKYGEKVKQETQEGQMKGVDSTPSVLINDKVVDWQGDYSKLSSLIDQAIQKNK